VGVARQFPNEQPRQWRKALTQDLGHDTRAAFADWFFGVTAVGAELRLPYTVKQAVGKSARLPYTLRAAAGGSRALPYTLKVAVGGSRALPYTLQVAVGASERLPYEIHGSIVGNTLTQPYTILAAVGASERLPYTLQVAVGGSRRLPYTVFGAAGASSRLRYQLNENVGSSSRLPYTVRAAVGQSGRLPYVVRRTVGSAARLPYNVRHGVGRNLTVPYALVHNLVGASLVLPYTIINAAGRQLLLRYAIDLIAPPPSIDPTVPFPEFRVRIAFASDPLDHTPTWTDVSADFLGCTIRRGRQEQLDRFESGTCELQLRDRSGDYDPTNGGSPYAGELVPLKRVKIEANYNGTGWSGIYDGHVESIAGRRVGPRGMYQTFQCSDAMAILNAAQVSLANNFYAVQNADDRIRAALADAGWPSLRTSIFSGNVKVQAITYAAGTPLLQVMQDVADAEFPGIGVLFVSKDGDVWFRGRRARFEQEHVANFGDDGARLVFPDLLPIRDVGDLEMSIEHVINSALIYPAGVSDVATLSGQRVQNAASIAKYGRRDLELPDLLVQAGLRTGNDALDECRAFAQFYVDNQSEAKVTATALQLTGGLAGGYPTTAYWDFLRKLELGQVISLYTSHPGGGGINGDTFFVEGYETTIEAPYTWETNLDLSPASLWATGAVLGI
jgi:hypothetical protein